jgi:hypothetical protein
MNTIPFPTIGQMAISYLNSKKDRVLIPADFPKIARASACTVADVVGALAALMGSEAGDLTMEYRYVDGGEPVPAEEVLAKMDAWYCLQSLSLEEWTNWLASVQLVYRRRAIPLLVAA